MPDPDLGPVIIGEDLLQHLNDNLGIMPDEELSLLTEDYGLSVKDAMSLVSLNNGGRVEYFRNVVDELNSISPNELEQKRLGKLCGNWVLHELGGLVSDAAEDANALRMTSDGDCLIPAKQMAAIIHYLDSKSITGKTAKRLLSSVFEDQANGNPRDVKDMIDEGGLWLRPMSAEEYDVLARSILDIKVVEQILKGQEGKVMFLVGRMMKNGEEGRVEPKEAEKVIRRMVEENRK
jgi:aspartyl-tRNA(Asn)/glutamyl-tRNA(Gln) amidotransferase subunit B